MVDYQYRVVYRNKPWHKNGTAADEWQLYCSVNNPNGRPYTNVGAVKSIVTAQNNWSDKNNGRYEYKAQKFPLTQEWHDV